MQAVDGVDITIDRGETLVRRRRIRLRQDRHRDVDPEADRRCRRAASSAGEIICRGPRSRAADEQPSMRRDPRQGDRHHLPGADDLAQPGATRSASRSPRALRRHESARAASRRSTRAIEMLKLVQIPNAEAPRARLSAPVLRRHAPARDDRDGARLQAQAADRRRADHRARRHHPGADPRPARRT